MTTKATRVTLQGGPLDGVLAGVIGAAPGVAIQSSPDRKVLLTYRIGSDISIATYEGSEPWFRATVQP